jgi:hypothetical protein
MPASLQPTCALGVTLHVGFVAVLVAVHLDDEIPLRAEEIDDIRTDRPAAESEVRPPAGSATAARAAIPQASWRCAFRARCACLLAVCAGSAFCHPSPKLLRSFGPPARGGLMRREVGANGSG